MKKVKILVIVFLLSANEVLAQGLSPDPVAAISSQVVDEGVFGFKEFIDADGDNNIDYCRFVGNPGKTYLSCQMGTAPGYLSKNPYGLSSSTAVEMGSPPWGIIPGTSTSGPKYCRTVPVRSVLRKGGISSTATELRCVLGTPPIAKQTQRFLDIDTMPCAKGNRGTLLVEADGRQNPYLYCKNTSDGSWNAQRQDPAGISWMLNGLTTFDKFDHSTTTFILLRQTTYKLSASDKPKPITKIQGQYPISYGSMFTTYPDGSSKSDIYSGGTQASGQYNDVVTVIKPEASGYSIVMTRSTCNFVSKLCSPTAVFNGLYNTNGDVKWTGPVPSASDFEPVQAPAMNKFMAVAEYQKAETLAEIATGAPDLAGKSPGEWSAEDIQRIVNILVPANGLDPDTIAAQKQNATIGLTTLKLSTIFAAALLVEPAGWAIAVDFELSSLLFETALSQSIDDNLGEKTQALWKECVREIQAKEELSSACKKLVVLN